jgi:hypothetical protein
VVIDRRQKASFLSDVAFDLAAKSFERENFSRTAKSLEDPGFSP